MSVCEPVAVTQTVLEKIESFMNDSAYKEMLENSSRYNSRLSAERRIRLPFVDNHTGVAQTHSDLFKNARQRMPGFREAQVYTYPSKRWCKRRRQYLMTSANGRRMDREDDNSNTGDNLILNEDSKDSSGLKDEVSKDQWYYEDEMMEMDAFEDHDVDSDYDYDEHYRSGRKKKRPGKPSTRSRGSSRSTATNSPKGDPETPASGGRGGRGRKRALLYDMDNDKPFACELCSARYKTRPGLTYHYTHTHKETKECDVSTPESAKEETAERASPKPAATPPQPGSQQAATAGAGAASTSASPGPPQPPPNSSSKDLAAPGAGGSNNRRRGGGGVAHASASAVPPAVGVPAVPQHQHHGPQAQPPKPPKDDKPSSPATHKLPDTPEMDPYRNMALSDDKARVAPSPYCDFCLGDSAENRKTSTPEELVSCSDCGRSGHPSCLQFTPNMIRSVRKYRWQCIECKCCSICGTSDNDDQLLFCDDCDRGYHMYCLAPPLTTPPEGSWSCGLCMVEFHRRGK